MSLWPIQDIGDTPLGHRRVVPVAGGTFEGERLRGVVLPHGGADWLLQRQNGSYQQDVRLTLQTDEGVLILMSYRGVRHASAEVSAELMSGARVDPSRYYLRIAPFFETSGAGLAWINNVLAVGVGERLPDGVVYDVHEVL